MSESTRLASIRRDLLPGFAALVALCGSAFAQQRFTGEPPKVFQIGNEDDWITDADRKSSPFAKERFDDRYREPLDSGRIAEVAESLVGALRHSPWEAEFAPVKDRILRQLDPFLLELRTALRGLGLKGPLDDEEQAQFLSRLNAQGRGIDTLKVVEAPDGRPVYFSQRSSLPEDWLYLYTEVGQSDTGDALYEVPLPENRMREWRLLENALSDLVYHQVTRVSTANVTALRTAVENWEKYLDKGYSMCPWESLLNGYALSLPQEGPPDHQWILLHPTLGLEASAHALDEVHIKESAVIELAGHLWYTDDFSDYYGFSLTASLREDIDPGLGVLLHLRRNWNLGVSWHSVDEDPFVFFSIDLLRFASSEVREYRDRYESLRTQLSGL